MAGEVPNQPRPDLLGVVGPVRTQLVNDAVRACDELGDIAHALGRAADREMAFLRGRRGIAMPEEVWHRLRKLLVMVGRVQHCAVEIDRVLTALPPEALAPQESVVEGRDGH
jgi:hypothetical protein